MCSWQLLPPSSLKSRLNRRKCATETEAKQSLNNHTELPSLFKCWISAPENIIVFYYRDVKSFHRVFQTFNLNFRHRYQEGKSLQLSRTPNSLICTAI